jgi:hypothetical protein
MSGVGACAAEELSEILPATTEEQAEWSPECFVCQSVANAVEELLSLYSKVNEAFVADIVKNVCDTIKMDAGDREICKSITSGGIGDELSWLAFKHRDAMDTKQKDGTTFAEKVCSSDSFKYCEVWIDSSRARRIKEERDIEAIFM